MSQALDLINNLSPDEMSRLAGANPNEARIAIGEDRTIYVPPELRRIAVQFDHNIETVTFECPRYWDGHDMSEMTVCINYMRQDGYTDSYPAAVTSVTEDGKMLFDWTISGNVTEVSGKLSFLVCVEKTDTDTGELLHHWSSELSQDMYVSGGMKCKAAPITRDPDLVSQILQRLSDIDDKVNNIAPVPTSNNFGVINARDFGAKGDGLTDDTAAIQAALYEAEATGKPLYIPAGTYLVSKTISTHKRNADGSTGDGQTSALNMYGAGMNTKFVTTKGFDGEYVFYIDVSGDQPRSLWVHDFAIDLVADVSGIYFGEIGMKSVIENLWIHYKYPKGPNDTDVRTGIYCEEATVVTFQRIKVQGKIKKETGETFSLKDGPRNIGITCRASYSTKFIDCDIIFCKWAIYLNGGSNNLIENCRIDENEYGVYQNSTADSINYMPETRPYAADGSNGVVFKGTFRNLTIRKNRFECNNKYAIFLAAYSYGEKNYMYNAQITIADNDFSGLGLWPKAKHTSNREVFRKAIHLYQTKGVVIEGNAFAGMPYDESNAESKLQNLYFGRHASRGIMVEGPIAIRDNVATTWPHWIDDDTNEIVKTNTVLDDTVIEVTGFVNDIEANQSTRESKSVEIEVDDALDSNSANPVQNKVVAMEVDRINTDLSVVHATANAAKDAADTAGDIASAVNQRMSSNIVPRLETLEKGSGGGADIPAVLFTEQELTDDQKAQARKNIDAVSSPLRFTVTNGENGGYKSSKTYQELRDAYDDGRILICMLGGLELPLFTFNTGTATFCADVEGISRVVKIDSVSGVQCYETVPSITIGNHTWDPADEPNVDFTDTVNEMIATVSSPLRFTVTKGENGGYKSSKTFQELLDAYDDGRILICVVNGLELPLMLANPAVITFSSDLGGINRVVDVDNNNIVSCYESTPSITVGNQTWDPADEPNVDFTDTVNEMIDAKLGDISAALDELHAYAQALVNGGDAE